MMIHSVGFETCEAICIWHHLHIDHLSDWNHAFDLSSSTRSTTGALYHPSNSAEIVVFFVKACSSALVYTVYGNIYYTSFSNALEAPRNSNCVTLGHVPNKHMVGFDWVLLYLYVYNIVYVQVPLLNVPEYFINRYRG